MTIVDGKKLSREILSKVKTGVTTLDFKPVFCDVLVGNDPASIQYVNMKGQMAEKMGISFHGADFPKFIATDELIKEIKILNKVKNMCGIIVQLPLPAHLDRQAILDAIDSHLDVDCLGTTASDKFYKNYNSETDLCFPTALACMALLDSLDLDLKTKNVVVLGQGALVGQPVSALLRYRGLFPITVDINTLHKEKLINQADVIISGIGKGKHITGDMIKQGVVLIDAGTSESNNAIVGDVDLESVKDVASYVSPVPGGVGPVTVAMLLNNVLKVAQHKNKNNGR